MKRRWLHLLAVLLLLVLLVAAAYAFFRLGWFEALFDRARFERLLLRVGPWGPLIIIIAQVVQVVFSPLPGQVVGLASGYLYGVWWGTLYCMIGLALGSMAAMSLGRRIGRPLVERWAGAERMARLDGYARERGASVLLLVFLLPFLPDDICCLIAGLTPIRISELVLVAMVGRLPGVIVSTWIGAQARTLAWYELLPIALASLAMLVLFWRHQRRLERAMFALLDRLSPRRR